MSDYNEWTTLITRLISKCFSWNINILVTVWETQNKVTDPNDQEFIQHGPDIRSNPRDYTLGNCDVVVRMVQKLQTGEHGLIMQGSMDTYTKNRLDDRKGCKADELFSVGDN